MYSLYIDTHFNEVVLKLFKDKEIIDTLINEENYQSMVTMPSLEEILKRNNIEIKDINEILTIIGPGSFTGVRIGVTIAKMLAHTLNIPIKKQDYLQLMSYHTDLNYVSIPDNNGAFVGRFIENEKQEEYKYYKKEDYIILKTKNKVLEKIELDDSIIIKSFEKIDYETSHTINPLYIKNI